MVFSRVTTTRPRVAVDPRRWQRIQDRRLVATTSTLHQRPESRDGEATQQNNPGTEGKVPQRTRRVLLLAIRDALHQRHEQRDDGASLELTGTGASLVYKRSCRLGSASFSSQYIGHLAAVMDEHLSPACGALPVIHRQRRNRLNGRHPREHLPEDDMMPIKVRSRGRRDVEL